jgi:hypothetical protein
MDYKKKYLKYKYKYLQLQNAGAKKLPLDPDNNIIHNFDPTKLTLKDKASSDQFTMIIDSYKKFFINSHGEIKLDKFVILPKNVYLLSFSATGLEAIHPHKCHDENLLCEATKNNNSNINVNKKIQEMLFIHYNYEKYGRDFSEINKGYKLYEPGDIIPLIDLQFYEHLDNRYEIRGMYEMPINESLLFAINNQYILSGYLFDVLPIEIIVFFMLNLNKKVIENNTVYDLIIKEIEILESNGNISYNEEFRIISSKLTDTKYKDIINILEPIIKDKLYLYLVKLYKYTDINKNTMNNNKYKDSIHYNTHGYVTNITQEIIYKNSTLHIDLSNNLDNYHRFSELFDKQYNMTEDNKDIYIEFVKLLLNSFTDYIYCSQLQTMVLNIVNKLLKYQSSDILSNKTQFSLRNNIYEIIKNIKSKLPTEKTLIIMSSCLSDISDDVKHKNDRSNLARRISISGIMDENIKYNKKGFVSLLNTLESLKEDNLTNKEIIDHLNMFLTGKDLLDLPFLKKYLYYEKIDKDIKQIIDFIEAAKFTIDDSNFD